MSTQRKREVTQRHVNEEMPRRENRDVINDEKGREAGVCEREGE